LVALAATRTRRVYDKRHLVHGAPPSPGVYVWRDRNEQVLYVGRARDLRARLRSYFRSDKQRPQVEAALGAVERVEWTVHGSELEAALAELRLIRELRPPANSRVARPERYVWVRTRGCRRSSRCVGSSCGSNGCTRCSAASSRPPQSRGMRRRSSCATGECAPSERCRRAAARISRSKRALRRVGAAAARSTWTSS